MRLNLERHDDRCPTCGKFVEVNPDGFWDVLPGQRRGHDYLVAYCDEACADRKSPPAIDEEIGGSPNDMD